VEQAAELVTEAMGPVAGLESNRPSPVSLLFQGVRLLWKTVPAGRQICRAQKPASFGNNAKLGTPHERQVRVALELLAHKEYLSPSLGVEVIGGCTASHGHLVLFRTGDGD
jgi:hypothetical protein